MKDASFNPYSTGFSSFMRGSQACIMPPYCCFNPYSTGFSSFIHKNRHKLGE